MSTLYNLVEQLKILVEIQNSFFREKMWWAGRSMTFNPQKITVPVVKNFAFQHFNNVPLKQIERSCNKFLILLLFFYTKSFHISPTVCTFYVKGSEIWASLGWFTIIIQRY